MSLKTDKSTSQDRKQSPRPEPANLDSRYGKIGIPAVAAALQYWTAAKKAANAPLTARIEERFIELLA
jgi:hypothetical protein